MKSHLAITALVAVFVMFSCNKKTEETTGTTTKVVEEPRKIIEDTLASRKECYEFIQKKDTISLSYAINGATVNGDLSFDNHEKDSSHGKVEGRFAGDTLKLSYAFESEGSTSIRDVYFIKSGNSLLMGFGDMEEKAGQQVFKNPKGVKYDKTVVLVKTECE